MKRFVLVAATAVLGLATLTACGGGDTTPAAAPPSTPTQSAPGQSTPSQSATAAPKLATADVGGFGKVVVDGTGRTLYVFDNDTANPSKSTCDGECAALWPPVPAGTGTPQLDSINPSLVGTVTRTDGSKQLTLAGLPLYQYAPDAKPGDAKGQGVLGKWWVVGADGKKITTAASDSGTSGY
jgi:predicted lipoprotein with Yx(FWY)xxD motif